MSLFFKDFSFAHIFLRNRVSTSYIFIIFAVLFGNAEENLCPFQMEKREGNCCLRVVKRTKTASVAQLARATDL